MHILLPPSETKRSGGGGVFSPGELANRAQLGDARTEVRSALEALSADEDAAAAALKLGKKSRGEIAHNRQLGDSGTLPAIDRYTGVLYDALDASSLDPAARSWLAAHVSVQSALFGLLGAADRIPAYRLSAGSRLPGLAAPLKQVWREAHGAIDWPALGWILDLRSKDYAELAPLPAGIGDTLLVAQRGPDGRTRALNHFNKAAKGDLVRRLAVSRPEIRSREDLLAWARGADLELSAGPGQDELTLVTDLGAPATAGAAAASAAR
ncbi:YaaA family protein [Leucobacter soli]|uniref:Peroxide stress protein YaaA n=1 Tax=Leucobacter soli TaxID=2812850 RepID=A0A916K0W2_9MICO|nr:peroxide stress protein YaaA [Leucobacter soli]CAG7616281.1 hypothetical protein LEUCIP111803_01975 [Leucobacter soli]